MIFGTYVRKNIFIILHFFLDKAKIKGYKVIKKKKGRRKERWTVKG